MHLHSKTYIKKMSIYLQVLSIPMHLYTYSLFKYFLTLNQVELKTKAGVREAI